MKIEKNILPRSLIHPGPFNPVRINGLKAKHVRHFRFLLEPGKTLHEALICPLKELKINSASTTILGGEFEHLEFCVAPPDPQKKSIIAYSNPIDAGKSLMIFGNATIGMNQNNEPLVHCHAAINSTKLGLKGGHILPSSIIGKDPISVLVTSLEGIDLRLHFDPETNISLLQPIKESE